MMPGRSNRLPGLLVVLALLAASGPVGSSEAEVHDIATVTPPAPEEVKCGCSTCGNPCNTQPSPVSSWPPPPPPRPPKRRSPPFCPPPPATPYPIYGPPGNLYPVDLGSLSGARRAVAAGPPALLACGFLGLFGFWWS